MASGRPVQGLHGVWRSRGYGYVLRIGAGGLELFHVAGRFCYADPRRARDPDGLFVLYRPFGDGTVAFSGSPGQTRYVFDRLSELPAACTDRTPWPPRRIAAFRFIQGLAFNRGRHGSPSADIDAGFTKTSCC